MANEKRLIDANLLLQWVEKLEAYNMGRTGCNKKPKGVTPEGVRRMIGTMPKVDAVEVVHGRWILEAHEECANYRWNVTAECSECHHDNGEVYAGFFTGFPTDIARDIVLEHAESVKLHNYCPNCGAKMDGGNEDGR